MDYLTTLRLIHIVCGVFWTGSIMYLAGFIIPAVNALGPDGGKFMQQLAKTNKLPLVMTVVATLNVLAGILMLERLSGGFQAEWFKSTHAIILTTGGTLAFIAWIIGLTVNRPTVTRIAEIGKSIAASGTPPTPAQLQELQSLRKRLIAATNYMAVLLLLTVVAMSIMKYL